MSRSHVVSLFFAAIAVLTGQPSDPTVKFEVATIRLNREGGGNGFIPSPGRLRAKNSTLQQLIEAAFHLRTGTLEGLKSWMESDRYDVEGKASEATSVDVEWVMLRSLLIEAFHLRFHSETRQMTTLTLLASKAGLKFHQSATTGQKERVVIHPGEIAGTNVPFGHFVSILQTQLGLPITNESGVTGEFDLRLTYDLEDSPDLADGTSVFAALEDQLGLRLERRRGPVEVMVIDSAERLPNPEVTR